MDADEVVNKKTYSNYLKQNAGNVKHAHVSEYRVSYKLTAKVEGSPDCATPIVVNGAGESLERSRAVTVLCPEFFTPMHN